MSSSIPPSSSESPGHPCGSCAAYRRSITPSVISYGSKRVYELLKRFNISERSSSHDDLLIIQPTSIGSGISTSFLAEMLMDYMPEEYWDQDDQDSCTSKTRLECTKILWPSLESMQDLYFQLRLQSQRDPSLGEEQPTVFLSPRTFALMEPDIHCQMFHYHAQPFPSCQKVPHNKTYFRLRSVNGHEKRASDSIRYQCSCHSVIWFLMTSACLSKGAQGEFHSPSSCGSCGNIRQGYVEYHNFEMGILLHSSHRNGEFRVSNPICPIHSQAKESFPEGVTCIPIPFNPIDPTPYTSSFGDLLSQPFFHDDTELPKYPHIHVRPQEVTSTHLESKSTHQLCPTPNDFEHVPRLESKSSQGSSEDCDPTVGKKRKMTSLFALDFICES